MVPLTVAKVAELFGEGSSFHAQAVKGGDGSIQLPPEVIARLKRFGGTGDE